MLQVLVSIQALVLNEKPYYNEPGVASSESASHVYNENAFLITCKTSYLLLRIPPSERFGFSQACNEYANGCMSVGYYSSDFPRPSKSDTSFSGVQGEDHWHLLSSASSSVSTQWSFFGMFGRTLGSRDEAIQKQKQRNLQGQERLEALQEAKQNQWNLQECHENDNYWFFNSLNLCFSFFYLWTSAHNPNLCFFLFYVWTSSSISHSLLWSID